MQCGGSLDRAAVGREGLQPDEHVLICGAARAVPRSQDGQGKRHRARGARHALVAGRSVRALSLLNPSHGAERRCGHDEPSSREMADWRCAAPADIRAIRTGVVDDVRQRLGHDEAGRRLDPRAQAADRHVGRGRQRHPQGPRRLSARGGSARCLRTRRRRPTSVLDEDRGADGAVGRAGMPASAIARPIASDSRRHIRRSVVAPEAKIRGRKVAKSLQTYRIPRSPACFASWLQGWRRRAIFTSPRVASPP
jgi:hypothetical protein